MASSVAIDECGVDASSLLRRKLDRQGENLANTVRRMCRLRARPRAQTRRSEGDSFKNRV
jgi:hypothetical protein